MQITVVGFGIARDIMGAGSIQMELPEPASVAELKTFLYRQYPDFQKLRSLAIAVNNEYAQDDLLLHLRDDIVLIPPVSGG